MEKKQKKVGYKINTQSITQKKKTKKKNTRQIPNPQIKYQQKKSK